MEQTEQKVYTFTITASGYGTTPEEAWEHAVENIARDANVFFDLANVPDYVEAGQKLITLTAEQLATIRKYAGQSICMPDYYTLPDSMEDIDKVLEVEALLGQLQKQLEEGGR